MVELFSCSDLALFRWLLGVATALLHTTLDWHLLEVIVSSREPSLRCVTIGDVDLVPALEEYDRFLYLPTPLSFVYVSSVWPRCRKRLANLLGLKRPVVEALTWHNSEIGGSMSFSFLYDHFRPLEFLIGYRDDFVDLKERWASYQRQAFLMAFFSVVLFPLALEQSILPFYH